MNNKVDEKDYAWVVTEDRQGEEIFLGLVNDKGEQFIPVTQSKEEALALLQKLPAGQGGKRQVEAVHKKQIMQHADKEGFVVYLVDNEGKILEQLMGKN